MSTHHVNRAKHADSARQSAFTDAFGAVNSSGDVSLAAIAEHLDYLRDVTDDALGRSVIGAGLCVDETADPDQPGWPLDDTVNDAVVVLICAGCPVADQCLELELRLFGAERHGLWGSLGEDGRRALHPMWAARRGRAEDDGTVGGER